ncbi:MAG: hypothetical protein AAGF99_06545 [Bacteroidota bacterium]
MNIPLDQLFQLHRGTLPDAEADALLARLADDPVAQAEYERIRALDGALGEAKAASFGPHFADRVMHRVALRTEASTRATPTALTYESLRWLFVRVAVGVLLIVAGFAAVAGFQAAPGDSVVATALGLPSATSETLAVPLLDATVLVPLIHEETTPALRP